MEPLTIVPLLDIAGVFVFAVSGALAAARKRMDIFGFTVIALLTAVGGGTIRDLLVGQPIFWIIGPIYVWVALAAAILTFFFVRFIHRSERWLSWFDAIGLGVFCVLGAAKGYEVTGAPLISVMMGVISAVAGGMMRDVVCNEIPLIFHGEIYATAAFTGSACYIGLHVMNIPESLAIWLGIIVAIVLRMAAMRWGWSLPASTDLAHRLHAK
jgi:uncharacterized membrane protein YeiH